jgi:hypothetical protein
VEAEVVASQELEDSDLGRLEHSSGAKLLPMVYYKTLVRSCNDPRV